jgi:hypothetical protein
MAGNVEVDFSKEDILIRYPEGACVDISKELKT